MPTQKLAAELEIGAGLSAGFTRAFDKIDSRVDKTLRGLRGFSEGIKGMPKGDRVVAGLGRGFEKLTGIFRNTNAEIGRTHTQIGALRKQGRIYESLADHARKAGKAVQPWLDKIDRVNRELDKQERKLTQLRVSRERLNKATTGFRQVRERVAPVARRLGYAGIGAAVGTGYAAMRGFQKYSDFDVTLNTLVAEGVAETDIPAIQDQILKFAGETRFTAMQIGELLVSMKKDGQSITSELTGFGDLLKFAVAENKDINTAWDVTRTYINATNTSLGDAITLQEELSNATSLSKLQIEDYGFIAGKALSTFANLENFDTRGFNAIAGLLADTGVQAETVGITLRRFPLVLAEAAHGKLAKEKQGLFDALGINIANEKGQLKEITTILAEFNRVFKAQGFITDENKISTIGLTQLGGIFDTRYADAIGKMITGYQKIEKNIEGVGKVGTLDEKFKVHSETLFAAQKRFESAVESLGIRLFSIFDEDDTFIKMFDGMTAGVNRFVRFVEKHKDAISGFAKGFINALGTIGESAISIGKKIFDYFQERGPSIRQFFKDFWADLKDVWNTLKPVVMGVLGGFRMLFDTAGKLAGGNTKLLAWLTAAFLGFQVLKTPVMAANAAFNLVLGSIGKVRAAWTGLQGLETVGGIMPPSAAPKPKVQKRWGAPLAAEVVPRVPAKGPWGTTQTTKPPVGRFTRIFEKLKIGRFAKFGTLLASFGPMLAGLFAKLSFLMPVVGALGSAFSAVGTAIAWIVGGIAGLASLPVTAIVAGIVAVVAGGVALVVANWDKVKVAVSETWDSIKIFGSAVWETLKWLGGSIANVFGTVFGYADVVLKKFGIDITGIFTGLGSFFNNLFSGIWNGIKGIGSFLSEQFGKLMGWIADLNNTFQKFVGGWRDFFKKKNDEREGNIALKTELPQPLVNADKFKLGPSKMELEAPKMPEMDFVSPQEFITKQKIDPVLEKIPEQVVGVAIQALFNPEVSKKKSPIDKGIDVKPTGGFPVKTPTPKSSASDFLENKRRGARDTSIEYVDFKSVDALDQTLKSGFTSLLQIEDQILTVLKSEKNVDLPPLRTPESGLKIEKPTLPDLSTPEFPDLSLKKPKLPVLRTPELPSLKIESPLVEMPQAPDLNMPALEKPTLEALTVETPALEALTVESPLVEMPQAPDLNMPALEKPTLEALTVETPALEALTVESPLVEMPQAPDLNMPALEKPTLEALKVETPLVEMPQAPDLNMPVIETPALDALTVETPALEALTVESPLVEMPQAPDLKMPALEKPALDALTVEGFPVIEKPTLDALTVEMPATPSLEMPAIEKPTLEALTVEMPATPSLEMPAIEKPTLEALTVEMPAAPSLDMPAIEKPTLEALTVEMPQKIGVDDPTVPALKVPALDALEIQGAQVYVTVDEIPSLSVESPVVDFAELPSLKPLAFDKPPPIGYDVPPAVETTRTESIAALPEIVIPSPQQVSVPNLNTTENNTTENAGDAVEVTNTINVYQQPNEDTEALTARILQELERHGRTRYYD